MGWKQTLILGGAVLLLAACDRATAPIVHVRDGGVAANQTATPTTPTIPLVAPMNEICTPGFSINSGEIVVELPGECSGNW